MQPPLLAMSATSWATMTVLKQKPTTACTVAVRRTERVRIRTPDVEKAVDICSGHVHEVPEGGLFAQVGEGDRPVLRPGERVDGGEGGRHEQPGPDDAADGRHGDERLTPALRSERHGEDGDEGEEGGLDGDRRGPPADERRVQTVTPVVPVGLEGARPQAFTREAAEGDPAEHHVPDGVAEGEAEDTDPDEVPGLLLARGLLPRREDDHDGDDERHRRGGRQHVPGHVVGEVGTRASHGRQSGTRARGQPVVSPVPVKKAKVSSAARAADSGSAPDATWASAHASAAAR